ncbi:MAG: PAS domain-containing protein [Thermodesulfovibrionales bacterium]|nr:PAS domain-containing protein [Thermodesulfovibrionales bacterium]
MKELENIRETLESIINYSRDFIFIKDTGFKYIFVNKAFERYFKTALENIIGKTDFDLFPTETADMCRDSDEKALKSSEPVEVYQLIGGEYFHTIKQRIVDKSGNITGLISVIRNITTQKKAENERNELLDNMERILANIPVAIAYLDINFNLLKVNNYACALSGLTEKDIVGKTCYATFGEYANDPSKTGREKICSFCKIEECLKTRMPIVMERPFMDKFIKVTVVPEMDADGNIYRFLEIVEDITENKRKETAQALLQKTIDSVTDPIIVIGLDHEIKFMNRFVRENYIKHHDLSEALKCHKILHHSDTPCEGTAHPCPLKEVSQSMKPVAVIHEHYHDDGEKRIIEIIASPLFENGNFIGIIETSRDITEHKRMEEELLNAKKLEAVKILAMGIAHDFNNLLTSIMGNISFAKSKLSPDDANFHLLNSAERSSLRASDLINQFTAFAMGMKTAKKKLSISSIINHFAAASSSNIKCNLLIPAGIWMIKADEKQISHVLHNLITNATDVMSDGGTIEIIAENVVIDSGHAAVSSMPAYKRQIYKGICKRPWSRNPGGVSRQDI